jgi:hypothetical protein
MPTHGKEQNDHFVTVEEMHGKDTIGYGRFEADALLSAEQTEQDSSEHKERDASAATARPKNATKVHRHHDTERRTAG